MKWFNLDLTKFQSVSSMIAQWFMFDLKIEMSTAVDWNEMRYAKTEDNVLFHTKLGVVSY